MLVVILFSSKYNLSCEPSISQPFHQLPNPLQILTLTSQTLNQTLTSYILTDLSSIKGLKNI